MIDGDELEYVAEAIRHAHRAGLKVQVWTVQAHVEFQPRKGANTITLQLPSDAPGFTVLDERFVARNYSKLEESDDDEPSIEVGPGQPITPENAATVVDEDVLAMSKTAFAVDAPSAISEAQRSCASSPRA